MKRILLILMLCISCLSLPAFAEGPELQGVFPSDESLSPGGELIVSYEASEAGTLQIMLYHEDQAPEGHLLENREVSAGAGQVIWNGTLSGEQARNGTWRIALRLTNAAGAASMDYGALVEVVGGGGAAPITSEAGVEEPGESQSGNALEGNTSAGNALEGDGSSGSNALQASTATATPQATTRPYTSISNHPDSAKDDYWQMDVLDFDIEDPATQAKLWEVMMQPITVLDVDSKGHVYPLVDPEADSKKTASLTGQIHGQTQGVNVIRKEGDWSLIEYFSNDGFGAPSKKLYDYSGQLVEGWVRTNRLKTVEPNTNMGLVIDKLHQRMYIFEQGVLTGELLISTGKATTKEPNVETPAGEYLTESWVGMFESYGLNCDLAIRINGGVLLHEVPHVLNADGGRNYKSFEPYLGQKASHGCVRVQRVKNEQGQNMQWLWDNLKRNTKVLIISDVGRKLPPPDMNVALYYNPDGGKNYHANQNCPGVKDRYLPLAGEITYGDLYGDYSKLTACQYCAAPAKVDLDEYYGTSEEIPDEVLGTGDPGEEIDVVTDVLE